ncbi:hypothetical protein G6F62_012457 [Rhizopus arrhizus]|uniref:BHLH domain-containing protein n=1 Tax=Rhizopus oryzae TaxID=64495 RepID=A0A9P6XD81_RHIOR|nr:hypothetical protein G6F23_012582 [Rhizopus arrhizus]KAG0766280.1 hypothetical protein G6F24_003732 [Rhizopus arrhizus]KAG0792403.1 hypothetical protein G6F22_005873 [Rhizopus arrhizus]KAG0792736.1 hypothetical protein G6F21_004137 [Rhizopus arrhizus]KAG0819776.1 hypothetical protein G6F20_000479 [Rhizopus arrhizus]
MQPTMIERPTMTRFLTKSTLDPQKEDTLFNDHSNKKPLTKAERRAEQNATERARRECLNAKFRCLAQTLPNLIHHRRPSKSQIVEKALDWVKQSIAREEHYRHQILLLQREKEQLLFTQFQLSAGSLETIYPTFDNDCFVGDIMSNTDLSQPQSSFKECKDSPAEEPNEMDSNNQDKIDPSPLFLKYHSPYSKSQLYAKSGLCAIGFHTLNTEFDSNRICHLSTTAKPF